METEADMLAFQLLAPVESVQRHLPRNPSEMDLEHLADIVEQRFGLPRGPAEDWAAVIAPRLRRRPRFADWLKHT